MAQHKPSPDEAEDLAHDTLAYAQKLLTEQGGFAPFGTLIQAAGDRSVIGSDEGDVTEAIEGLRRAFRGEAQAGLIRASAVCFDIVTRPPGSSEDTDAICIEVESRDGFCRALIVPYHQPEGGEASYGEPIEAEKRPEIFRGPHS